MHTHIHTHTHTHTHSRPAHPKVAKTLSMGKGAPQIIACLEFHEGEEHHKNWLDLEAGNVMYFYLS